MDTSITVSEEKPSQDNFMASLSLMLAENKAMQEAAKQLMLLPCYAKYKPEEMVAILMQAKILNIDPFEALNSDLFILNGKVGMYSQAMGARIRRRGHSITKDPVSDNKKCILNGRRADNGDTLRTSYTIEEAEAAGLVRPGSNWTKHPADMLFARAMSKLSRQLFPDVIRRGTYSEGEIEEIVPDSVITINPSASAPTCLSDGQVSDLEAYFKEMPDLKDRILKMYGAVRTEELHPSNWNFILGWVSKEAMKRKMDGE